MPETIHVLLKPLYTISQFHLVLLVLVSQRFENIVMDYMGRKERLGVDRGAPPSYVESTITIYIIGNFNFTISQIGPTLETAADEIDMRET